PAPRRPPGQPRNFPLPLTGSGVPAGTVHGVGADRPAPGVRLLPPDRVRTSTPPRRGDVLPRRSPPRTTPGLDPRRTPRRVRHRGRHHTHPALTPSKRVPDEADTRDPTPLPHSTTRQEKAHEPQTLARHRHLGRRNDLRRDRVRPHLGRRPR